MVLCIDFIIFSEGAMWKCQVSFDTGDFKDCLHSLHVDKRGKYFFLYISP